jgi:hypothetical protein
VNHGKVLEWAIRVAGGPFLLSCLLDRAIEPRWRPEWIGRHELTADAVGRIMSAWHSLDESARPDEWRPYVEAGQQWINDTGSGLAAIRALLEGGLMRAGLAGQKLPDFLAQTAAAFVAEPTPESVARLVPLVFTCNSSVPEEVVTGLKAMIEMGLKETAIDGDERQLTLICGVHLAVERKDAALADAVAQASLEIALYSQNESRVRKAVLTIIECTGAYADHACAG